MGLELDTLSTNDDVCVIYCNTTGNAITFHSDFDDFKRRLLKFGVKEDEIRDYFGLDELQEFFDEFDIEYNEEELKTLMEGKR